MIFLALIIVSIFFALWIKRKSRPGTLFSDGLVHVSWLLPICIFLAMSAVIVQGSNLFFDISLQGFECFYKLFKLPLLVLTLIVPIMAVSVSNHRSKQTLEQIDLANINLREAQSQNIFQNYFKHKEIFNDYMAKFSQDNEGVQVIMLERLYRQLFPHNSPQHFEINTSDEDRATGFLYRLGVEYEDLRRDVISLGDLNGVGDAGIKLIYTKIEDIGSRLYLSVSEIKSDKYKLNKNFNLSEMLYRHDSPFLQLELIEKLLKSIVFFVDDQNIRILRVPIGDEIPADVKDQCRDVFVRCMSEP